MAIDQFMKLKFSVFPSFYAVELAALEETRASLTAQHTALAQELQQIATSLQTKANEASTLEQHLEEQRGVEQAQQSLITEATKMLDKLLSKRSLLIETVHSRTRKMRDLGTIPHAELEEYKTLSEKHIMHRLNSVNEQVQTGAYFLCALFFFLHWC